MLSYFQLTTVPNLKYIFLDTEMYSRTLFINRPQTFGRINCLISQRGATETFRSDAYIGVVVRIGWFNVLILLYDDHNLITIMQSNTLSHTNLLLDLSSDTWLV